MSVTIEKVGQRVYFAGNTFPVKDRIKSLGGHWDGDRRQWWIGAKKLSEAELLVAELTAPQFAGAAATAASARVAKSVGLSPDTPAGIVADKLQDAGDERTAAELRKPVEDVSDCRVYAKVEYKGRTYYVIAETKDRTRCRLATLDEGGPVFWADMPACKLLRTYQGREKFGGYSRGTITVHDTIGSLRRFRDKQKRLAAEDAPQCPVCGKRNNDMVHDLETGMMCCRGCADMPE